MSRASSRITVASQSDADRLYADLQHDVGERARRAQTMADVEAVAERVRLLKSHRPRTYDVLASSDLDGSAYVEHGFATEAGFIATEEPRVLCEHHEELTPWPCAELAVLIGATAKPESVPS